MTNKTKHYFGLIFPNGKFAGIIMAENKDHAKKKAKLMGLRILGVGIKFRKGWKVQRKKKVNVMKNNDEVKK